MIQSCQTFFFSDRRRESRLCLRHRQGHLSQVALRSPLGRCRTSLSVGVEAVGTGPQKLLLADGQLRLLPLVALEKECRRQGVDHGSDIVAHRRRLLCGGHPRPTSEGKAEYEELCIKSERNYPASMQPPERKHNLAPEKVVAFRETLDAILDEKLDELRIKLGKDSRAHSWMSVLIGRGRR